MANLVLECGELELKLEKEFGAGRLFPIDNENIMLPSEYQLQPGSYVYTVYAGAGEQQPRIAVPSVNREAAVRHASSSVPAVPAASVAIVDQHRQLCR